VEEVGEGRKEGRHQAGRCERGQTAQDVTEALALYPPQVPTLSDSSGRGAKSYPSVPVREGFATRLLGFNAFVICLVGAGGVLLLVA
jgi:hypothetical protein